MESVGNGNRQLQYPQTNTGIVFGLVDERYLEDPISSEILTDAVIDPHGHTFERKGIENIIDKTQLCPMNRQPLKKADLISNRAISDLAAAFRSNEARSAMAALVQEEVSSLKVFYQQQFNELKTENKQLSEKVENLSAQLTTVSNENAQLRIADAINTASINRLTKEKGVADAENTRLNNRLRTVEADNLIFTEQRNQAIEELQRINNSSYSTIIMECLFGRNTEH